MIYKLLKSITKRSRCFVILCMVGLLLYLTAKFGDNSAISTLMQNSLQEMGITEKQFKTQQLNIGLCDRMVRTKNVEKYCENYSEAYPLTAKLLKSASISKLRAGLNTAMIVDDVNKVMFCLHAKVGCSTWKWLLVNNTLPHGLTSKHKIRDIHTELWHYNLSRVGNKKYSDADIQYRLDNYYKVMVVRHPYDRLQSLYKDKFVGSNAQFHDTAPYMRQHYHPNVSASQFKISFPDMIQFIKDGHRDVHWQGPYHQYCAPCLVHYDYIVKLETHDQDAGYILSTKLKDRRSRDFVANRKQGSFPRTMLGDGKHLELFRNLTSSQLKFLNERLQPDLDMFGYSFDENTLVAKCGYGEDCC